MRLVLDTGALIALERADRLSWRLFREAHSRGEPPITHGGVVAQAWRKGGSRQALLAKALAGVDVRPLDDSLGRATGRLLADTRTSDVVDAALVVLTRDDDLVLTSDPGDLDPLARALGREIAVIVV